MTNINLGCGAQIIDGWINVDYSLGAVFAKLPLFSTLNRFSHVFGQEWDPRIRLHDLRKRFPWADDSADVVYASHTLEHFSREDGLRFLRECFRILKPEGVIRILVPDLAHNIAQYNAGHMRADEFVKGLGVLYGLGKTSWKKRLAPLVEYPHKCHYDTPTLVAILQEIGFAARGRQPYESEISGIARIEDEGRTKHAVIVEGKKSRLDATTHCNSYGVATPPAAISFGRYDGRP